MTNQNKVIKALVKVASNFEATSVLAKRYREENKRSEWALVSKKKDKTGKRRVLYWFGTGKPSDEEFAKQERRIQYYKHK